jgi:hypothetical protein
LNTEPFVFEASAERATSADLSNVRNWSEALERDRLPIASNAPLPPIPAADQTVEHRLVLAIIRRSLETKQAENPSEPVKLIIYGEAGSGKSRLIQTISALYAEYGRDDMVLKLAPSASLASLIGGRSIEEVFHFRRRGSFNVESLFGQTLQAEMAGKDLLVIDHISLMTKTMFSLLSDRLTLIRHACGMCHADALFGGMDVLICGDFHQQHRIGCSVFEHLYHTESSPSGNLLQEAGRRLFESFSECVILRKMHTEPLKKGWHQVLERFRTDPLDSVTINSIQYQRSVLREFDAHLWEYPLLISNHRFTRSSWNFCALQQYSTRHRNQVYTWESIKVVAGNQADGPTAALINAYKKTHKSRFGGTLSLCEGAKVVILTSNIPATVIKIALAVNEEALPCTDQEVFLQQIPAYILVQLNIANAIRIPGLPAGVIPLLPFEMRYMIKPGLVVTERQYPLVLGYATAPQDWYGRSLVRAVLDIPSATPNSTWMNRQSLYDILSRFADVESLMLLRPLDTSLLDSPVGMELKEEEHRLNCLSATTRGMRGIY